MDPIDEVLPQDAPRFTASAAAAGANMRLADLNFWSKRGDLRPLFPFPNRHRWRMFSFKDIVALAVASSLIEIGLPSRMALDWGREVARGEISGWDYVGTLLIWRERNGTSRAEFVASIGEEAARLISDKPIAIIVSVKMIVGDVLQRLQSRGFIGKSDDVGADNIVGNLMLPVPKRRERAAAPAKRAPAPAKRRKRRSPA